MQWKSIIDIKGLVGELYISWENYNLSKWLILCQRESSEKKAWKLTLIILKLYKKFKNWATRLRSQIWWEAEICRNFNFGFFSYEKNQQKIGIKNNWH